MARNARTPFPEPELFPELAESFAPPPAALAAAGRPLSQVAPGIWCMEGAEPWDVPSHVVCRLVPLPEAPDTYRLEPEPLLPGHVRMTADLGARLGLARLSETTLRRLMWGGFVDHVRLAPGCIFLSLESLRAHLRAVRHDLAREDSWWTPERLARWKATCAGGACGPDEFLTETQP